MCSIGIKGRVFCDSPEEAMSFDGTNLDGKGFMDTVVDSVIQPVVSTSSRVVGGAVDQAKAIVQAPAYVFQYVTCTVPSFGEWDSSWSGFGQNCSWQQNPLIRSMDVFNRMVLGTVNDVTGGAAHDVVRELAGSQSYSAQNYFPELDRSPEGLGGFAVRILSAAAAVRGMQLKSVPAQAILPKAEPVACGTPTVLDRAFAKEVFNRRSPAMGAPILSTYVALSVIMEALSHPARAVKVMKFVAVRTSEGLKTVLDEPYVDHPSLLKYRDTLVGAGYARFQRLDCGRTEVVIDGQSGNFPTGLKSVRMYNEFHEGLYELDTVAPGLASIAEHWQEVMGEDVTIIIDHPAGGE